MAALGFPALQQQPFEWTYTAAYRLICLRRQFQDNFEYVSHNQHTQFWVAISNALQVAGFTATPQQCRNKWYALKYGYENLKRSQNGENPHNQPITNPTLHDRLLYQELSDEFWLRTGNYIY
jgi:hypothetical protein